MPSFTAGPSTAQETLDALPALRTVVLNDPNHPVAIDYAFFQHQKEKLSHVGSALAPHYKPHELLTVPPSPKDITLELLLASQAHLGHATSLWNPANARYIFGVRGTKKQGESPIHIISLDATASHLRRACKIVSGVTDRGGLVLFVGTREGQARAVVKAAQMAQGCHLFTKWIPGSITNGQQILGRCAKKVYNEFDEEVPGFEDQLGTKAAIKPDLVVCLNPLENYVLLHECGLNNIPTIGIIDTDANPTWVTYPIPANDDSLRCIQVIAGVLGRAGQEGQQSRLDKAKGRDNIITYSATHGLTAPTQPAKSRRRREPKPRQPRQTQVAPVTDETEFNEEYDGVPVEQFNEDNKMLADVEKMMLEEGEHLPNNAASTSTETTPLLEEVETEAEPEVEADLDDNSESTTSSTSASESIDQSLVDESFASKDYIDEDLAQFGGADQLTTPSSAPNVQTTQAPESDSLVEQEADVEQELGEDRAAAVASREEAPVTEATTESIEKEEQGKEDRKQ